MTHAATITVTSTADSGSGSLRDALAIASHGDTIDATSLPGIITLTNGELLITKSIDIIGPGPDLLAVNGNHRSRVFHILPTNTVVISGLSITNGALLSREVLFSGAGIFNDDST